MVAPLHVHRGAHQKLVHDGLGRRPPVVHVAHQVQAVHGEVLHKFAHRLGQSDAGAGVHGPLDEGAGAGALGRAGGQKLLDEHGEVLGHEGVGLGQEVPLGCGEGHGGQVLDEVGQGLLAPVGEHELGLLRRVAHGAGQGGPPVGVKVGEGGGHEPAHGAGAVAQQVGERVVLAVDVRGEQLGAPRQGERPFQERDFRRRFLGGGVQLGQRLQARQFGSLHAAASLQGRHRPRRVTEEAPRPGSSSLQNSLGPL